MARYDYKCSSCGNVFEVEHPMSETPEVVCPNCGAPAAKTFSASGIKFEGSGFYNTDQRHQRLLRQLPAQPLETKPPRDRHTDRGAISLRYG